ncbi:MAG: helix-hairpin-helix domain-containing protein, partial [Cyanobacteria bacterium P01_H01_bin.121]
MNQLTLLPDCEPGSSAVVEYDGDIDKLICHNPENGYTVATLKHKTGVVKIVGYFPEITTGQRLRVSGRLERHDRFGEQLTVTEYDESLPQTIEGLAEEMRRIPGFGPSIIERVIEQFGEQTWDVLNNQPERVAEVHGVGPKLVESLADHWLKDREFRKVRIALARVGIVGATLAKILKTYGGDAPRIVFENPYRLIQDIDGIGFDRADVIALKSGKPLGSAFRLQAGVLHLLKTAQTQGNCFLPKAGLIAQAIKLLRRYADNDPNRLLYRPTEEDLSYVIQSLQQVGDLILESMAEFDLCCYLPATYYAEVSVARRLIQVLYGRPIQEAQLADDLSTLSPEQREAVEFAVMGVGVLLISGGPGTGKTYTQKTIVEFWEAEKRRVALAAPTGRAAQRLAQATGRPASTIHRLLEYNPIDHCFNR